MNRDKFSYIYQQDGYYLITYDSKPFVYVDLDNFNIDIDKIKTKEDESKILNNIIDYMLTEYNDIVKQFMEVYKYE